MRRFYEHITYVYTWWEIALMSVGPVIGVGAGIYLGIKVFF